MSPFLGKSFLLLVCFLFDFKSIRTCSAAAPNNVVNDEVRSSEEAPPGSRRRSTPGLRRVQISRFSNDTTTTSSSCIGDDAGFRSAVVKASTDPNKPPTVITLCSRVKIASTRNPTKGNVTGIDITNKRIELTCYNPSRRRCVIDGQKKSRILFGSSTFFRATNFDFINGRADVGLSTEAGDGGALYFDAKSTVTLNQCSFRNNVASFGGAITVYNSTFTLRGTRASPVVFSNNSGYIAGTLYVVSTYFRAVTGNIFFTNNIAEATIAGIEFVHGDAALKGVVFKGNTADEWGTSAVAALWSKLQIEDTQFIGNSGTATLELHEILEQVQLKTVRFADNDGGALRSIGSLASLTNCTFRNNQAPDGFGSDIRLGDVVDPGSFISCTNTVFCDGVDTSRIYDGGPNTNTDCIDKGIVKVCPK